MNNFYSILIAAGLSVLAAPSHAQKTLGELLDQGGEKMSKAELVERIPDTRSSFFNAEGNQLNLTYRKEGAVSGSITFNSGQFSGRTVGLFGTWAVEDNGRACVTLASTNSPPRNTCGFRFKLRDEFFSSDSDSDRNAPVTKVNLLR